MKNKRPIDPAIVVIGGGTGLSTMLRGLKKHSKNITAIVTVADDGGGSGSLREELGMPPPGDVRNCIQSLANTEPTMEALLSYRFTEGSLAGQSFGNLFLAALNGMSETFDEAVRKMSDVLAITGRVLPVTNENVALVAKFDDGTQICGESKIADFKRGTDKRIERVYLVPERPAALPEALEAISRADIIVIGPGSLYTSILPNFVTAGISRAVALSDAFRVYVLNVMTQDGETEKYSASDHIKALFYNAGEHIFDWCLGNSTKLPSDILEKYALEGAAPVLIDEEEIKKTKVKLRLAPIATWSQGFVRHDTDRLAEELMKLYRENSQTKIFS